MPEQEPENVEMKKSFDTFDTCDLKLTSSGTLAGPAAKLMIFFPDMFQIVEVISVLK